MYDYNINRVFQTITKKFVLEDYVAVREKTILDCNSWEKT